MKLLSIIVSLLLVLPSGNGSPKDFWDDLLDKYEELCNACMENKSRKEILQLSNKINELLKHPEGKMDSDQRARFTIIQNTYRGIITFTDKAYSEIEAPQVIKTDTIRTVEHIKITDTVFVKEILGSIELNQYVHNKDTVYHIIQYQSPSVAEQPAQIAPEPAASVQQQTQPAVIAQTEPARKQREPAAKVVKVKEKKEIQRPSYLLMGDFGVGKSISSGATLGVFDKWGGYLGFHSDFNKVAPGYSCTSDGMSDKASRIITNGNTEYSRFAITAGALFEVTKWMMAFAGAGYGNSAEYWQDIDDTWMDVSDISAKGAEVEAGAIFHLGILGVSFGVSTTRFKTAEFKVGAGFVF